MTLPQAVSRYLSKQSSRGLWRLARPVQKHFLGVVVIPSLAEGSRLFATLASLSKNPENWIKRFLCLVVINNSLDADPKVRHQNQQDLVRLEEYAQDTKLNLAWIDAASSGLEVPSPVAGVGFVRKLGMDAALEYINWAESPLLACLDADTLVDETYLEALARHFGRSSLGAAVLPFQHQPTPDPILQEAIDLYEIFLRSYVFGLRLAASPYAFHSIGSAMACQALAYVRCGGMNSRKAGEDFYFLQKIAKTDGVEQLTGTCVFPEARVSQRVPFGTGRSLSQILQKELRGVQIYPVEAFKVLSNWLSLVQNKPHQDAAVLLTEAGGVSTVLEAYLNQLGWSQVWTNLQRNYSNKEQLLSSFHVWFDGFKTLRLIHLLCDSTMKRGPAETLLPDYFRWANRPIPCDQDAFLDALRQEDRA